MRVRRIPKRRLSIDVQDRITTALGYTAAFALMVGVYLLITKGGELLLYMLDIPYES